MIRNFGDAVKSIRQPNGGINQAKTAGFNATSGSLVLFLDADDQLHDDAIEQVLKHYRPGLSKIQFNLEKCDADGNLIGEMMCKFPPDYTPDRVRREFAATGNYTWPVSSGNFYTRELVSEVLPVPDPAALDGALNTVAPLYGEVLTIDRALGLLRIHDSNDSRSLALGRQIAMRRAEFEILKRHAAHRGVRLPDIDFLDTELKFINCRMAARRLGLMERSQDTHSLLGLWRIGLGLCRTKPLTFPRRLMHGLWITGLLVLPKAALKRMVTARANRIDALARRRRLRQKPVRA